jgi:ABC-type polysaccharide/polyol phosphate export permease
VTLAVGQATDTLRALVGRELRIRYKGSLLGLLWAWLSPLGTVLILHLLFTRIVPLQIPHYAAFVYSGLLPWTWFQGAVQTAASSLLDNRDLVRMPFFPRPILPAVVTTTGFLLYLAALPVLLLLLLAESVPLTPHLLLLPLVWIATFLFTLAAAVMVSALGALVKDVQHVLGVVLLFGFYLTPVFYDLDRVGAAYARWLRLNPLTILVEAHRDLTLYGRAPDAGALLACAGASVALLGLSVAVFRACEHLVVEEV